MSKTLKKSARVRAGPAEAVFGCRVHSGWAAVVVVGFPAKAPVVLDRQRIINADRTIPGSKQPYHYVETWPLPKAQAHLDRCNRSTRQMTQQAFEALMEAMRANGHTLSGCAVLTASGRPVPSLAEALSSHAMLHTAEGEFYRNAIIEASQRCGVPVTRIREKELLSRAEESLALAPADVPMRLTELGRGLGPPWSQDEKLAALAAWLVLAADQPFLQKRKTAK